MAALATHSPLGMMASFMGIDALTRAQGLYTDLVREAPGTLLYWLNHQPHPHARYLAIVREGNGLWPGGEMLVPPESQDLARVAALRGRTDTLTTSGSHDLEAADATRILQWLATGEEVR
jgi:hypothetical protein